MCVRGRGKGRECEERNGRGGEKGGGAEVLSEGGRGRKGREQRALS